MQATLIVVDGAKKTRIPLRLPTTIGRGKKSKLRVRDSAVSRRHCELFEQDDHLFISDLESSNGTMVNGQKIEGPTQLKPDDVVSVGPVTFRFELNDSSPATDQLKSTNESQRDSAKQSLDSVNKLSDSKSDATDEDRSAETVSPDDPAFEFGRSQPVNESAILSFRMTDEGSELDIENADQFLRSLQESQVPEAGPSVLNDLKTEPSVDSDDSRLNQFLRRN